MLGLRFCVRAFSSCGKRGPLFIAVSGPLTVAASLVAEHRLQTRRLSTVSRAQLLHGMWDLPRPGLEPGLKPSPGHLSAGHTATELALLCPSLEALLFYGGLPFFGLQDICSPTRD